MVSELVTNARKYAFASAFLMPRAGIIAQRLNDASVERILSAKRRWGVSAMALAYRLRSLGLLSEWRHTQTVKKLAQMGYRSGEPGSLLARESSQLLVKVFDVLRAKGMPPPTSRPRGESSPMT
ncbi:ImmA/IrrE family metallo-endopeptidase [Streptomyces collinus]|uniref:ImmA/IrrE family metallo-endopeptidase n=1 Tax=Streptomyces collinus TaxID=42684 RepID=UPI0033B3C5D6